MRDISLEAGDLFIGSDIDYIIQQIDILFETDECEVFGSENYGTDFRKYLWDLKISNSQISSYVHDKISNAVDLKNYVLTVNTSIMEGTLNDIILVSIYLSSDADGTYEKTYKIE
jgi:hypothetical protein